MKSSKNIIYHKIIKKGRGSVFTNNDFYNNSTSKEAVDKALSRLAKENKINRLARGIYNYPIYSKLLKRFIPPRAENVANAVARKHHTSMLVDRRRAANLLGLSEQVPAQQVFITDGPNAKINIGKRSIIFKHTTQNIEMLSKFKKASVIVQALNSVGQSGINNEILNKIKAIVREEHINMKKCVPFTPKWIQNEIKKLK